MPEDAYQNISSTIFSGDGTLSCVDLRQKKLEEKSDCSESELLCVAVVKVYIFYIVL